MAYDVALFAAAFTEWDRRYRADPEQFMNEAARLLKEDADTYGAAAAPYFVSILAELATGDTEAPREGQ